MWSGLEPIQIQLTSHTHEYMPPKEQHPQIWNYIGAFEEQ